MVNKYAKHLENHDINVNTGSVWVLTDVPNTWRDKTKARVEYDGYYFDKNGVAHKAEH